MKSSLLFTFLLFSLVSCKKEGLKSLPSDNKNASKRDSAIVNPLAHVMDSSDAETNSKITTLRNQKIPKVYFEGATILSSVTEWSTEKVYLIFNEDEKLATLYLPNASSRWILTKKGSEGNYYWTDGRNYILIKENTDYILKTFKERLPLFKGH